jgi:hypothetical protein
VQVSRPSLPKTNADPHPRIGAGSVQGPPPGTWSLRLLRHLSMCQSYLAYSKRLVKMQDGSPIAGELSGRSNVSRGETRVESREPRGSKQPAGGRRQDPGGSRWQRAAGRKRRAGLSWQEAASSGARSNFGLRNASEERSCRKVLGGTSYGNPEGRIFPELEGLRNASRELSPVLAACQG